MAASSSQSMVHDDDREGDVDPSLMLALRLQEEEDVIVALSLQESESVATPSGGTTSSGGGRLPGELLNGRASKAVQHLGKGTVKKLEAHFKKQPMSLRELLAIFHGPRREEMLMLIDAGQRARVEAELVALALDFPI